MTSTKNNDHSQGRRNALRGLAAGSAVAGAAHWSKPVVESVVLPAHAAASGFGCNIQFNQFASGDEAVIQVFVNPPPEFPPGALIHAVLTVFTNQANQFSAEVEQLTDASGEAVFTSADLGMVSEPEFQTGESPVSATIRAFCVDSDECDADCEIDVDVDVDS